MFQIINGRAAEQATTPATKPSPDEETHYQQVLKRLSRLHNNVKSSQLEIGRVVLDELEGTESSIRRAARDLGIPHMTLTRWVNAARAAVELERAAVPQVVQLGITGLEAIQKLPLPCDRLRLAQAAQRQGWKPTKVKKEAVAILRDAEQFDPANPVPATSPASPTPEEIQEVVEAARALIGRQASRRRPNDRGAFATQAQKLVAQALRTEVES